MSASADKSKRWTLFRHSSSEKRSKSAEKRYSENEGLPSSRFNGRKILVEGESEPVPLQYSREEWSAIRIQTAFRGFLVRTKTLALTLSYIFLDNSEFCFSSVR